MKLLSKLWKLVLGEKPGLHKSELDSLLSVCTCEMVTARESFHRHECRKLEVIDLTGDADAES
jgi:hypothetical protein